ncbi:MAG: helix-turn-helix domain-containing protein [Candidatus Marinimicrobia bacterium]|nr:helix-turn-helix domain-containing protein [Candidatus Neomarinimicrobiota bacterium]
MLETWSDIKSLREEKGISLQTISEKMRLPVERITYLETGDFKDADPIITKFQLKIYAKHLGLDYDEIIRFCDLNVSKSETKTKSRVESFRIKKTRPYRGRKKEPSKALIYTLIVLGALIVIFVLNRLASNWNITSDVFEMTEQQQSSLDNPDEIKDTTSFKPILPQAVKESVARDITEDMQVYHRMEITFPVNLNIFPKETVSYRHEVNGDNPQEDFIMKNTPKSLFFTRPGRMIFYNTEDTRFVVSGFAFRENNISRVVVEINTERELIIYTK